MTGAGDIFSVQGTRGRWRRLCTQHRPPLPAVSLPIVAAVTTGARGGRATVTTRGTSAPCFLRLQLLSPWRERGGGVERKFPHRSRHDRAHRGEGATLRSPRRSSRPPMGEGDSATDRPSVNTILLPLPS